MHRHMYAHAKLGSEWPVVITIVIVPILRSSTVNFPTIIPPVEPSNTRIFGAPMSARYTKCFAYSVYVFE